MSVQFVSVHDMNRDRLISSHLNFSCMLSRGHAARRPLAWQPALYANMLPVYFLQPCILHNMQSCNVIAPSEVVLHA